MVPKRDQGLFANMGQIARRHGLAKELQRRRFLLDMRGAPELPAPMLVENLYPDAVRAVRLHRYDSAPRVSHVTGRFPKPRIVPVENNRCKRLQKRTQFIGRIAKNSTIYGRTKQFLHIAPSSHVVVPVRNTQQRGAILESKPKSHCLGTPVRR
jgi:hypothetical protein